MVGSMTHIACLVELGYKNSMYASYETEHLNVNLLIINFPVPELFYLAHDLVDVHSETAIAWLAVGCYYYLIGECSMSNL